MIWKHILKNNKRIRKQTGMRVDELLTNFTELRTRKTFIMLTNLTIIEHTNPLIPSTSFPSMKIMIVVGVGLAFAAYTALKNQSDLN